MTELERWAVISDVHGNRWALEAVLEHAAGRGATRVVNLGDVCYGPLDPAGTLAMLQALPEPPVTVRGNQDRHVVGPDGSGQSLAFTRAQLDRAAIAWLAALPLTARIGDVLLCHGTPVDDERPLAHRLTREGLAPRPPGEVAAELPLDVPSLVLCGHTHLPTVVEPRAGLLVVNPGSVGLPAYAEETPWPFRVEVGAPHARYALISRTGRGWLVELCAVPYDHETAARVARENGRPDWATALRTGRAS